MNLHWRHMQAVADGRSMPPTEFYQSGEIANASAVLHHLRVALPDVVPQSIAIESVWHVPSRNLGIVYRVDTQTAGEQIITVRFFARGESKRHFETAVRAAGQHGHMLSHLANWDAIACRFPHDAGLPQVASLIAQNNAGGELLLRAIAPDTAGRRAWGLLSYLPERRCVLRFRYADDNGSAVAKVGEGASLRHARLSAIHRSPQRRFAMPEPITTGPDHTRWETFVEGQPLTVALRGGEAQGIMRSVASAVAALHALPTVGLPTRGAVTVLTRLQRKVLPQIQRALPQLSEQAAALTRDIERRLATLPTRMPHTIHGDLHSANLLIKGTEAVLIDLDELAHGDPAYDLALLGSRLMLESLLARDNALDHVPALVAALPAQYEAAGGDPIPEQVFAWYMSTLLISRQIKTCIRHLAPDLPILAESLLDVATATLARGRFDGSC